MLNDALHKTIEGKSALYTQGAWLWIYRLLGNSLQGSARAVVISVGRLGVAGVAVDGARIAFGLVRC